MNSTDVFDQLMHNSDISMRYRRPELWIREFILKMFMLMFTNAFIKWVPLGRIRKTGTNFRYYLSFDLITLKPFDFLPSVSSFIQDKIENFDGFVRFVLLRKKIELTFHVSFANHVVVLNIYAKFVSTV